MAFLFDTTASRSKLMRKIKSHSTKPELVLRKKLWSQGYRYRLHVKNIPGKPDIVFRDKKVVVFIDGDFWHGKDWEVKKPKIKSNREYWIPKIEKNMARDTLNNGLLIADGWRVIRFWTQEINKDLDGCILTILNALK